MTYKEKEILERDFKIYDNDNSLELEKWTDGGVDMIISIDKESDISVTEQFREYVNNFDIDEEIDIYRQDKRYCDNFTIRQSVKDFEEWEKYIKDILEELEK